MADTGLQNTKTKKILIVEDEGDMCLLLNILLNGKEMELDHGKNLSAAEEYLQTELEQNNFKILEVNYRRSPVTIANALGDMIFIVKKT